jgi:hypothetical protein
MAKSKRPPSKAAKIRELLEQKPDISADDAISRLKDQGIDCTKGNFYQARIDWKKKKQGGLSPSKKVKMTDGEVQVADDTQPDLTSVPQDIAFWVHDLQQENERLRSRLDFYKTMLMALD